VSWRWIGFGRMRGWMELVVEKAVLVDRTYREHSAGRRDGAHGACGLTDGVTEHIDEVDMILWGEEESIAAGCN
jgi:hypothetical protein